MLDLSILDEIRSMIYISDIEDYELVFLNHAARERLGIRKEKECYGKCYQILQNRTAPCEFCNNNILLEQSYISWSRKYYDDSYLFIQDHRIWMNGKWMRLECAVDISDIEETAQQTRLNLETERTVVECVQKLISLPYFEKSVSHVLNSVLQYYKGARGYVFQFDWEKGLARNSFEECVEGVFSEIDNLQNVPIDTMKFWTKNFERSGYMHIEDMELLKTCPERKEEYNALSARGIKSLMAVPFFYDSKMQGFIGVDNPEVHVEDISLLQSLTYFISAEMEKRELNKHLMELSYLDLLTKCQNRNAYNKLVEQVKNKMLMNVGVAYVDMNGLKYINDTLGHTYGDKAITATADIIRHSFDEKQIFRISGDEYVVICIGCDRAWFSKQVGKVKLEFGAKDDEVAAVGYIWEIHTNNIEHMVYCAEQLMYINKQRFHNTTSNKQFKNHPKVLSTLINDLETEQFVVFLQPQKTLNGCEDLRSEALIRRIGANGNIILPFEFVPVYEHEKVISEIDYYVLGIVCKQLTRWKQITCRQVIVSVNVSRITLAESGFVDKVVSVCNAYGIDPKQIELEITESSETLGRHKMVKVLERLKTIGFSVALDDLGSDYASLRMLMIPDIDVVKLDKSFVERVTNGFREQTVIRHIIELSHALELKCVAEGVETETQLKLLQTMDCDFIQGYLVDKPMRMEQYEEKYIISNLAV